MEKQVLLSVHFRIQGKEKQKIHFINANTNNEKMCKCKVMRTLHCCIYYDSVGKNVGLEGRRSVLTLLASRSSGLIIKCLIACLMNYVKEVKCFKKITDFRSLIM